MGRGLRRRGRRGIRVIMGIGKEAA